MLQFQELDKEAIEETASKNSEMKMQENQQVPLDIDISFPLKNHTGLSLRNLVNSIYSRASLINKATGACFYVSDSLKETLQDNACTYTVANFRKTLKEFQEKHGEAGIEGLKIEKDKVTFFGFPQAVDHKHLMAFGQLAALMNEQALRQKRIQAKEVKIENEKYAMRTWLIRLGMNGDEFKETRKIIMKNLCGNTAFRTKETAERAQKKALAKRQQERASSATCLRM